MTMNSRSFVDQVVMPRRALLADPHRFGKGVDFSADGLSLVDMLDEGGSPRTRLIWFKGYMAANAGVRGFGSTYRPAHLHIVTDYGFRSLDLESGGRLSRRMVLRNAGAINRVFGPGTAESIDLLRTLVVADA